MTQKTDNIITLIIILSFFGIVVAVCLAVLVAYAVGLLP